MFKIGDTVKVIDASKTYSFYDIMAEKIGLSNFEVGDRPYNGEICSVIAMDDKLDSDGGCIIGVESAGYKKVYLIGSNGLELVDKEQVAKEQLGYCTGGPLGNCKTKEPKYTGMEFNAWQAAALRMRDPSVDLDAVMAHNSVKYGAKPITRSSGLVDHYCFMRMRRAAGAYMPDEISHAIKKLSLLGGRGDKSIMQDVREVINALEAFIDIEEHNNGVN